MKNVAQKIVAFVGMLFAIFAAQASEANEEASIRQACFERMITNYSDPTFLDATPDEVLKISKSYPQRSIHPVSFAKIKKKGKFRGIPTHPETGEFGGAHYVDSITIDENKATAYYEWWASPEGGEFYLIRLIKSSGKWKISEVELKGGA